MLACKTTREAATQACSFVTGDFIALEAGTSDVMKCPVGMVRKMRKTQIPRLAISAYAFTS